MEKRQHSISKLLRMTPEEAKLLEEKAKQAGMTESQYLRLMISQKPNDYPEVRQLLRDFFQILKRIKTMKNRLRKRLFAFIHILSWLCQIGNQQFA